MHLSKYCAVAFYWGQKPWKSKNLGIFKKVASYHECFLLKFFEVFCKFGFRYRLAKKMCWLWCAVLCFAGLCYAVMSCAVL